MRSRGKLKEREGKGKEHKKEKRRHWKKSTRVLVFRLFFAFHFSSGDMTHMKFGASIDRVCLCVVLDFEVKRGGIRAQTEAAEIDASFLLLYLSPQTFSILLFSC